MIEFINVSKSYWTGERRKIILEDATFRIDKGNSFGILAKNGSGKTTIINMVAGLITPDEGQINRKSRISFPLGSVGGVEKQHSGRENARFIASIYGTDPDYFEAYCRYICDIEEYFDRPLKHYSSGMMSRFNFAVMMALDFDFYLLDESLPEANDAAFRERAGQVFSEKAKSATIIAVSHSAEVLERYCKSAAVLKNGKLYFFDNIKDAKTMYDYT